MTMLDTQNHDAALTRVQAIIAASVPTGRCEFHDYQHRIRCGDMDEWGNIQEISFVWRGAHEAQVEQLGEVLAAKLRSGGLTTG